VIRLNVQGRAITAERGESLLDVLRREGFEVPSLCHHEALTPYGACRLCLVEAGKPGRRPRLTTACDHPALPDLVVLLDTDKVQRARRLVLELLLAHAPDVPNIVELARSYGVEQTRFDRVETPRDCILCGLCERVCREVVSACAIGFAGRGHVRRVEHPYDDPQSCIGCGACEALCPTGVLHPKREALARFRLLPGEQRQCRYSLMGLLPGALCANDYRCERCETEHAMTAGTRDHPLIDGRFAARGGER
jgi:NADH dehydrogenase/NADH:ubiquinone oxidoreductase subunit G